MTDRTLSVHYHYHYLSLSIINAQLLRALTRGKCARVMVNVHV